MLNRPILLCCKTDKDKNTQGFCVEDFSEELFFSDFLNEVAVNENGLEWSVEVLFHNLKGYDGMFVLEELFDGIIWSRIKSVWE